MSEMISLQSTNNSINNTSLPYNGASSSISLQSQNTVPSIPSNQCSTINEDSLLGKDDLTNYVLLWEV
jgi:hypothetical protein